MLFVFGGKPGTGKTALATRLARVYAATYLRIDAIEEALRSCAINAEIGTSGYVVARALAEANLRLGGRVVADSVNPVAVTRNAWRTVAASAASPIIEIEIVCSDVAEHRRRIETRSADIPGFILPTWADVVARSYEDWDCPHIVFDTAFLEIEAAFATLLAELDRIMV